MPVDPTLSLNVVGGKTGPMDPGQGYGLNPFSLMGSMAETQNKLNQVKLFNQTNEARKKAGRILATAPDLGAGVAQLAQDPDVMAFVPEIAESSAGTYNAILESGSRIQGMGWDAYSNFIKGLTGVIQDQTLWGPLVKNSLELSSPAVRPALAKTFQNIRTALTTNLDPNPEKAREQQIQRLVGMSLEIPGMSESIQAILGQEKQIQVGPETLFGRVAPGQGGIHGERPGAYMPGNSVKMGIGPQLTDPNALAFPGSGGGQGVPRNELALPQGRGPVAGLQPGPEAPLEPPPEQLAGDGKPLLPKNFDSIGPKPLTRSVGGVPVWPNQEQVKALATKFVTDDLNAYRSAQQSQAMLAEMDTSYDVMARGGGFQVPGAAAGLRNDLAKLVTTVEQMTGSKPSFDVEKIASAEQFIKDTTKLGFALVNSMFGAQREAATVIMNAVDSVPGITNSYLGGKLLVDSIRATTQRAMDEYEFKSAWSQKYDGNLAGADVAFAKEHPAEEYAHQVLERFGLTKTGFKDLAALENAVAKGFLTAKQAADIAKKQEFELPGAR